MIRFILSSPVVKNSLNSCTDICKMISFPNCKINLGLSITGKLPSGYHTLETVMYPVPLCDVLEVLPSASGYNEFTFSGIQLPGAEEENLCFKAWKLLAEAYNIGPVRLHLHKIIPAGAGLGGGSADAAFTLKALNQLFRLRLSDIELEALAVKLGMDCPFFITNRPSLATGRGEITEPINLNLSGLYLVIVKPEVHISTAEAYSGVTPKVKDLHPGDIIHKPIAGWLKVLMNDFEESVFTRHPEIDLIKQQLLDAGALYAAMSGSGSAVYGIFRQQAEIKDLFSACFVWQGQL